ncbi:hypothetical protein Bca4012_010458 [Brassica carinata]
MSSTNNSRETNDETGKKLTNIPTVNRHPREAKVRFNLTGSPYSELGLDRSACHMASAAFIDQLAISRSRYVPTRSPYGERIPSRPARHMASAVHPGPLAIWRARFVPARSPYGERGLSQPVVTLR